MIRTHANPVLYLIAIIGLTLYTWLIGVSNIQYTSEVSLAFQDGFPGDSAHWDLAGDPVNLALSKKSVTVQRKSENRSYAKRAFTLPEKYRANGTTLRIRGEIKTNKIARPLPENKVAAFMIWFADQNGKILRYTTVQALTGDFPSYRAEKIVSVPKEAESYEIVLLNRNSNGAFSLTNADVAVVKVSVLYKISSFIMYTGWFLAILLAFIWTSRRAGYRSGIPLGLFTSLIAIGVLLPESITYHQILPAYQAVVRTLSISNSEPLIYLYKLGHFLFFFVVSLILLLNRKVLGLTPLIILCFVSTLAVATEGLQLHLFSRTTRFTDIVIDLMGFVVACVIVYGFEYKPNRTVNNELTN